jgi:hypothetical protein
VESTKTKADIQDYGALPGTRELSVGRESDPKRHAKCRKCSSKTSQNYLASVDRAPKATETRSKQSKRLAALRLLPIWTELRQTVHCQTNLLQIRTAETGVQSWETSFVIVSFQVVVSAAIEESLRLPKTERVEDKYITSTAFVTSCRDEDTATVIVWAIK